MPQANWIRGGSGVAEVARTAFQLAINPVSVCSTAAKRQQLAEGMVSDIVSSDLNRLLAWIDEARTKLSSNGGFLSAPGAIDDLLFRRAKGKAALIERAKPLYAAIGAPVPPDLLAKFDPASQGHP